MTWSDPDRPDRRPGHPWPGHPGFGDPVLGAPDGLSMADAEVEDELRVLLQRAAPHLPAPADRMDRIRELAARNRRRRRAAGLGAGLTGGLLAAALAAAPAIAPAPTHTALRPSAGGPAADAPGNGAPSPSLPPEGASPAPSVSPSSLPVAEDDWQAVRYPELNSVIIRVPPGWSTLVVRSPDPLRATGYTASQPLAGGPECASEPGYCTPLTALATDGALVSMTLLRDPAYLGKIAGTTMAVQDSTIDKECSLRGGTSQLTGHRTIALGDAVAVVELTACLNHASTRTLGLVQKIVDSVRITGGASGVADGSLVD
ncbi:hypothetical protein ACFWA9_06680 [Kitasatospora sp. NPDC059973]|uniref:hypothetical protein n=1 Tax=Kitasatospora sp. NPDC059973 TaxID=3347020 RepID=UPI0036AA05DA